MFKSSKNLSRRSFLKSSGLLLTGAAIPGNLAHFSFRSRDFDIVIKNGLIIDGTGKPGYSGSVGIIGDTIAETGSFDSSNSKLVIDAAGQVISPGFINIHGHTGLGLLENPEGMSSIMQGITTEITGQCGGSVGPYRGRMLSSTKKYNSRKFDFDRGYENINDFLDLLDKQGTGINLATMIGHGTVRSAVIGQAARKPTSEELTRMKKLIDEGIQHGAVGFSTGLEYNPGSIAETDELIELAKALKPYDLPYASHMRNEDKYLLDAVSETLTIGEKAGCPVQISHLKVQGKTNWKNIDRVFELIETASEKRGNVHFDRYPYTAYSTGLSNLFPIWSREGGTAKFMERLKDQSLADKIRTFVENKISDLGSWNSVMISSISKKEYTKYIGWRMDEIADDLNTEPYDLTLKMMQNNAGVGMVGFGMSEENTGRILSHPLCMVCSDGAAMPADISGRPHPRSFGAFVRILEHYVRDQKLFDLPAAIKKMSSMPAEKLSLKKRGRIEKNYYADIAVFNPETVKENATFAEPLKYATGINHVLVNGKITVQDGKHTGELAGRTLRSDV